MVRREPDMQEKVGRMPAARSERESKLSNDEVSSEELRWKKLEVGVKVAVRSETVRQGFLVRQALVGTESSYPCDSAAGLQSVALFLAVLESDSAARNSH